MGGRSGETYSHYEIMDAGLDFIRDNKDRPFFCYLPITPPHGMYDIPADDPVWALYEDDEWMQRDGLKQDVKNYAAMVSLVDRNLGQVLDLLEELSLDENTVVFFTGDNGGQDRFRSKDHPRGSSGPTSTRAPASSSAAARATSSREGCGSRRWLAGQAVSPRGR